MSEPDAYYGTDRLQAEIEDISESRVTWLEDATINLLRRWKAELEREGSIEDLGHWEHDDIIQEAVNRQIPYDKCLWELCYRHIEESDLHGEISWS